MAKAKAKIKPPELEEVVAKEIRWFIKDISSEGHLVDAKEHDYGSIYNVFDYNGYASIEDAQEALVSYARQENNSGWKTPTLYGNDETYGTTKTFFVIPRISVRVFHRVVK